MKLNSPPPTMTARQMRGYLSFAYQSDGSAVARRFPSPRRGKLSLTTEQQVATWDDVMQMIRYCVGEQLSAALEASDNTGFYARDMLTAAAYGHMVSWPGWGVFADGPARPPLYVTSKGNASYPPRALGDPQAVNAVTKWDIDASGDPIVITAETWHDASPVIERFCCQPEKIQIVNKRRGKRAPHGYKLFFPCEPVEYAPVTGHGKSHEWQLPASDFEPPCDFCKLVVVEKAAKPLLNWTSMPFDCPTGHTPVTTYYYYIAGTSECCGSPINPCPPPGSQQPNIDFVIADIEAAGYTVFSSGTSIVMGVGPSNQTSPRYFAWGVPVLRPPDVQFPAHLPGVFRSAFSSQNLYDAAAVPDAFDACNADDPHNYIQIGWVIVKNTV